MNDFGAIVPQMHVQTPRGPATVQSVKSVEVSLGYGKFDVIGLITVAHDEDGSFGVYNYRQLGGFDDA